MAGREWAGIVGMVTGLVGLVISGGTAFLTIVRQVDDVRVLIGDPPVVYISNSGKTLESNGEQELTFMNAGNRNAAISNIKGLVIPLDNSEGELPKCKKEEALPISFKPDSFVIKPGEVIVSKVVLQEGFWKKKKTGDEYVADNTFFNFKRGAVFMACLSVSVATPDAFYRDKLIPAFKYTLLDSSNMFLNTKPFESLFEQNRPITLLKRTGTILDSW
jgi:hypothetical protein